MTVQTELERLNAVWNDAWLKKDAATVARLTTDDYAYVGPTGVVMDRAAILAVISDPTYQLAHWARTEMVVVPLGDNAALVRHRGTGAGTFRGEPFAEDHRCCMICDRSSGEWRVRYEQCSTISD